MKKQNWLNRRVYLTKNDSSMYSDTTFITNKTIVLVIVFTIIGLLIQYFIESFIKLDLEFYKNWSDEDRGMYVFRIIVTLLASIFIQIFSGAIKDEEKTGAIKDEF